jgi:hypothetical protein
MLQPLRKWLNKMGKKNNKNSIRYFMKKPKLKKKKKALLTHEPEHKQNYKIEKNKSMQLNPSDSLLG